MKPTAHIADSAPDSCQGCAESTSLLPRHTCRQRKEGVGSTQRKQRSLALQLLTEEQVSAITAIPMGTLRRWRCVGDGPPYIKMGNGPKARVRYDAVDILAYVEAGKRYPIRAGNTGGQHGNY